MNKIGLHDVADSMRDVRGDIVIGVLLLPVAISIQDFAHAIAYSPLDMTLSPSALVSLFFQLLAMMWLFCLGAIVLTVCILNLRGMPPVGRFMVLFATFLYAALILLAGSLAAGVGVSDKSAEPSRILFLIALFPPVFLLLLFEREMFSRNSPYFVIIYVLFVLAAILWLYPVRP